MDDLISRRAAIDRINKQREHLQPDIYPQDKIGDTTYRICAEFIARLPSAQPEERKKGAWILGFDNQYLEKYYFCSKCGSRKYMEDKPLDNFCANCGADMRGEQDG